MQMNLIEFHIFLTSLLVGTATATEIFYVLPDISPNISCPPHQCKTFSQYLLDNDGTLPVTSNVEYHLLPGEHYLNATKIVVFTNFQNFSLVGKFNEQLQLPPAILLDTNVTIYDSYNITIINIICRSLFPNIGNLQLVNCISCTIENVTLIGCGLSGHDLIGRSYLNNLVISLIESSNIEYECYDHQGIMLQYSDFSFNKYKSKIAYRESTMIMQNVSIHYENKSCYIVEEIIKIKIELYQVENSVDIIISDSKFDNMIQKIIGIKGYSYTTSYRCTVWIINCTFESNFIHHSTSLIMAEVRQFNIALSFLNCEFHHNESQEYLVSLYIQFDSMHGDFVCTNITFKECNFISNRGGLLQFINMDLPYCRPSILFIGPICIEAMTVTGDKNMIYIREMFDVHIMDQ